MFHYYVFMYVHCLERPPRNNLNCVGWDVKRYSLTHFVVVSLDFIEGVNQKKLQGLKLRYLDNYHNC